MRCLLTGSSVQDSVHLPASPSAPAGGAGSRTAIKKQPHPIAVRLSDLVRLHPGEIRARQLMKLVKWMSLRTDPFHGGIRSPAACRQAEIQCCHACHSSAVVAGCCQISNAMCTDPAPSAGLQRLAVVESPAFQAGERVWLLLFRRPDSGRIPEDPEQREISR